MRSELVLAINQLCAERKLSPEVVMEAVEASLISAYKRNFGATTNIEVQIDSDTSDVRVFAAKEVVDDVQDRKAQITLEEARQIDPEIELGGTVLIESTPKDFGRIAAQTAKQVILQRIREAERDALYSTFADSAGEIAHGTIQSMDYHSGDVIVNIEGAEALLPAREQVPSERYRRGTRVRAYVLDVRRGSRGPQITLSRRSPALLRRLLELEVPEIFSGAVEIKAIAREAGSRSKVAVHATQEGVDPVGSCVGVRGGRIQNVVNELNGEKIDVVQWDPEIANFIGNSLSPAKVMNVLLENELDSGKTATVIVPDRQLSLAIGKEGQNARLAAKLTGWRIDIKSATEAAEETLGRLEDAQIPQEDMDLLMLAESILRTQAEEGLTEEQRETVVAAVEGREQEIALADEATSTPEEPAGAEETAAAKVEGEPEAAPEIVAGAEPEAEAGVVAPETEAEEPALEAEPATAETEESALPAEPARAGLDVPLDEVAEEQLPALEEGALEDSFGWLQVEPEEDYYSGWSTEVEEEEEDKGSEWIREEFEQIEAARKAAPKKRKKKRGRRTSRGS
ncbi:MAG: transcription termination factor NusA [Anaerolineae bacterium]|jgi:N utilization substance protein A